MANKKIKISFKPIPEYGDLMSLDEFIDCCKSGGFIDYDGHGKYAFKDKISDKIVIPSHIIEGNIDKNFTHVVWFNK